MSLKSILRRIEQVEQQIRVGFITIRSSDGTVTRVRESAVMTLFQQAIKIGDGRVAEVPDAELVNHPTLLAIKRLESSDEDGSILELAKVLLLGPAGDPPPDVERSN